MKFFSFNIIKSQLFFTNELNINYFSEMAFGVNMFILSRLRNSFLETDIYACIKLNYIRLKISSILLTYKVYNIICNY